MEARTSIYDPTMKTCIRCQGGRCGFLSSFRPHESALWFCLLACALASLPATAATVKVVGNDAKNILALMDALEEHEDVQHVYGNFDIPDEVLQTLV